MLFDKVKIVVIGFAIAALAGGASYAADIDYTQFGAFGPAIGLAIGALLAYFKKELTGYGNGVPIPEDAIPGGAPLPSGGEDL